MLGIGVYVMKVGGFSGGQGPLVRDPLLRKYPTGPILIRNGDGAHHGPWCENPFSPPLPAGFTGATPVPQLLGGP